MPFKRVSRTRPPKALRAWHYFQANCNGGISVWGSSVRRATSPRRILLHLHHTLSFSLRVCQRRSQRHISAGALSFAPHDNACIVVASDSVRNKTFISGARLCVRVTVQFTTNCCISRCILYALFSARLLSAICLPLMIRRNEKKSILINYTENVVFSSCSFAIALANLARRLAVGCAKMLFPFRFLCRPSSATGTPI